jgi:hypothetical protein
MNFYPRIWDSGYSLANATAATTSPLGLNFMSHLSAKRAAKYSVTGLSRIFVLCATGYRIGSRLALNDGQDLHAAVRPEW